MTDRQPGPLRKPKPSLHHFQAAEMRSAAERREKWLVNFVTCNYVIADTCAMTGISPSTYQQWRSKVPGFADRVAAVRTGGLADDAEKAVAIDKGGLEAFSVWCERYLHMTPDPGHIRITDAISRAKAGRITLILAPPEAGKTTTLENYCTFRVAADANIRITYVHQSHDFARDVVGRIQNRLTDTDAYGDLIARYGPFRPDTREGEWSANAFEVAKKRSDERGATFKGRGIHSKAQGVRTDLLLIDDIQDIETIGQTERLLKILRQTFFTRAIKTAPIVMVGNRVDVGDVWEGLLEEPGLRDLIDVVTVPAIEDGVSLFPSIYSTEDWATKRRIVGEDVWFRNYVQNPKAAGDGTFTIHDLQACLSVSPPVPIQTKPERYGRVMAVDPAIDGGTAVITFAWDRNMLQPIDVTYKTKLYRNESIYLIVADHAARYEPSHCVFETATMQKGLARDERMEELAREHGFRMVEHQTAGRKMDPVVGVGAMASSFIRREIVLPADRDHPDRCHPVLEDLWAQLQAWRPDVPTRLLKQDLVMAMWFAHVWWRERRGTSANDKDSWRAKAMPAAGPRVGRPLARR